MVCPSIPPAEAEAWVQSATNATLLQLVHVEDFTRSLTILAADVYVEATELYARTTLLPLVGTALVLFLSKVVVVDPVLRIGARVRVAARLTAKLVNGRLRARLAEMQQTKLGPASGMGAGSTLKGTSLLAGRLWSHASSGKSP